MTKTTFYYALLLALCQASVSSAWVTVANNNVNLSYNKQAQSSETKLYAQDRRHFVTSSLSIIGSCALTGTTLLTPLPSHAATSPQQQKDEDNIVKGYNRLQYLLDNWVDKTTVCKIGQETTFGDKCERTPVVVMEYLGFKSTSDPLFKADTAMLRLKDLVPSDREVDFYDAVDAFAQNAEEASSMAFVSSWGEANPGGGKDRVALFIERAKNNVIASRDALKTIIDILDLKA